MLPRRFTVYAVYIKTNSICSKFFGTFPWDTSKESNWWSCFFALAFCWCFFFAVYFIYICNWYSAWTCVCRLFLFIICFSLNLFINIYVYFRSTGHGGENIIQMPSTLHHTPTRTSTRTARRGAHTARTVVWIFARNFYIRRFHFFLFCFASLSLVAFSFYDFEIVRVCRSLSRSTIRMTYALNIWLSCIGDLLDENRFENSRLFSSPSLHFSRIIRFELCPFVCMVNNADTFCCSWDAINQSNWRVRSRDKQRCTCCLSQTTNAEEKEKHKLFVWLDVHLCVCVLMTSFRLV